MYLDFMRSHLPMCTPECVICVAYVRSAYDDDGGGNGDYTNYYYLTFLEYSTFQSTVTSISTSFSRRNQDTEKINDLLKIPQPGQSRAELKLTVLLRGTGSPVHCRIFSSLYLCQ